MSEQTFTLPDLGEGLTEAEIVRWLVAVGDEIAVDQVVIEVETAKSLVEVPSPYGGSVSVLHAQEGETLDVGRPLITVTAATAPPAAEQYREEEKAGSGNVLIGYGTSETPTTRRRRAPKTAVSPVVEPSAAPSTEPRRVPRVTSPLVRRMARDAGLSVAAITGTGPDGLITRRDVLTAMAGSLPATPQATAPAAPSGSRTGLEIAERVPMSGFRKTVSAALSRSRSEIPEATVWVDVDFTELLAMREQSKARGATVPGLLSYLARFTVAALKTYPELNGEVDVDRNELIRYDGINLGIAVQGERGLVVPAVQRADQMTTLELDTALRSLTEAARQGRSSLAELTSGTFTLNNYGAFNVDGSAAIINHPQVAMLGFGRVIDRPWVVDGQIVARKIGQMSFVFDHRVCDGGVASGFMRQVADAIENPAQAISHL